MELLAVNNRETWSKQYVDLPSCGQVCLAQKWMVSKAQRAGKPVFVAGQMLPSMLDNPRPTRAEMTDTANCVFDGVDGIVLLGETANGKFASLCAKTAANILTNAEVSSVTISSANCVCLQEATECIFCSGRCGSLRQLQLEQEHDSKTNLQL
jgi:pyruvate kinase